MKLVSTDNRLMAEELLFESYSASCVGDDLGGRASACLALGRLFLLHIDDAEAAVTPLEYASGHFMTIETVEARDYAHDALHLYAAAKLMCGDTDSAQAILEVPDARPQTPHQRVWQSRLWRHIKEQAGDAAIAAIAAIVCREDNSPPANS